MNVIQIIQFVTQQKLLIVSTLMVTTDVAARVAIICLLMDIPVKVSILHTACLCLLLSMEPFLPKCLQLQFYIFTSNATVKFNSTLFHSSHAIGKVTAAVLAPSQTESMEFNEVQAPTLVRCAPFVPLVQFVSALSPSPTIPSTLDVQPSRCPVHQHEPYLSPSPPHPAAPPPPFRLLITHTRRSIKILRILHASQPIAANRLTSILNGITAKNDAESSMGASL